MLFNGTIPIRFKPTELHHFNWLYNVSPCFPVNASKINIITDPRNFYDTLCERFKNAERRISMASLYIGTGALERMLLQITKERVQKRGLRLSVLLDYQRGTRGQINSRTLLQDIINEVPNCNVSLYQTPRLQGKWSKALPARYNELVGLQHMKLYITDDSVLLSGANCSNDYFQQRQDRYIEIQDPDLADYYCELIDEVCKISKKCVKEGIQEPVLKSKELLVQEVNDKMITFVEKWKKKQVTKLLAHKKSNESKEDINDTWVFPLVQMGEFQIRQDEKATQHILRSLPVGSNVRLATGYFNLTQDYSETLLKDCKAKISLLIAHPNANGFMGAAGPAGGIPHAYSLIAKEFWQQVVETNQTNRVQILEYERPGWTFHAKGLWYYPPGSSLPWATVVGSANMGERSARRDLEAQAAIFTASPDLQAKLHEECSNLQQHATECSSVLQVRRTPMWVRATVGLFRTYF